MQPINITDDAVPPKPSCQTDIRSHTSALNIDCGGKNVRDFGASCYYELIAKKGYNVLAISEPVTQNLNITQLPSFSSISSTTFRF